MSQVESLPTLKASVHDVRYFCALLRGVNFANVSTRFSQINSLNDRGLVVVVEEARTLLGKAYIFADVFDEFTFNADIPEAQPSQSQQAEVPDSIFEIPLNLFLECLNIFGTAGGSASNKSGKYKAWKKPGEESDDNESNEAEGDQEGRGGNKQAKAGAGRLEQFFSGSDRKTSMRLTYIGPGHPLTLIVAEDASGPTTTCEIATFDAEPHLELPFDSEQMVLKIILKSSWLRDALSELDPSYDKLTFIGNPPGVPEPGAQTARERQRARLQAKPILRIEATGTFGNTQMDYPNDRDVLESFECVKPVSFSYRFSHISRTVRALQTSVKTSLRIDSEGLLSLQFLMPSPTSRMNPSGSNDTSNFIEFCCLALEDELV
ncbi:Rad1-domain-containing protein [Gymnopus androsaceus JB14]|uniref:Rad1-domain-containing protein n=1 Tax=Gymnopus androsaceus JB14 TaxID=1447944 RepID=A0A6A4HK19_9AGAR|nr:Rad1-domain-containing protein [Gymnopus androsaceus JB14]